MASRLFSDDPYLFASGLAVGLVLNKVIPSRNLRLRTRLGLIFSCSMGHLNLLISKRKAQQWKLLDIISAIVFDLVLVFFLLVFTLLGYSLTASGRQALLNNDAAAAVNLSWPDQSRDEAVVPPPVETELRGDSINN